MPSTTSLASPIVFVVDDDVSMRESLELLIEESGWRAKMFASAEEFLAYTREPVASCLVLDVGLPNLNGLELQKRIAGCEMKILYGAGHACQIEQPALFNRYMIEFLTAHGLFPGAARRG